MADVTTLRMFDAAQHRKVPGGTPAAGWQPLQDSAAKVIEQRKNSRRNLPAAVLDTVYLSNLCRSSSHAPPLMHVLDVQHARKNESAAGKST